jgi:hypothetical protein
MNVLILTRASVIFVRNDKEIVSFAITICIIQDTFCCLLVSTSSTTLLNIALKTLGHGVVNNKPDIFLINTHSKSNSSNYDLQLVTHPFFLNLFSLIIRKLSMIKITANFIVSSQDFRELLTLFTRDTIDYA